MHKLKWNHELQARRFDAKFIKKYYLLFVCLGYFFIVIVQPISGKVSQNFYARDWEKQSVPS